jgi:hypothetical protein
MLTYFNYIIFNNKQQNKQIDFVHSTVTNCNPQTIVLFGLLSDCLKIWFLVLLSLKLLTIVVYLSRYMYTELNNILDHL